MPSMNNCSRSPCDAEVVLRSACKTLLSTSPEVVRSLIISLGQDEYPGSVREWEALARTLAEQYELAVEVSIPRDDLRIRFSRYVERGSRQS
jgi:hypothetical protein